MEAAVQFSALLGVTSPSPSHCSKRQNCSSVRPHQRGGRRLCARAVEVGGAPGGGKPSAAAPEEPSIDFAFSSTSLWPSRARLSSRAPRLLPDGTPDVHYRTACGGQKLRDIMLDNYIDLYGPYDQVLLNCSRGSVCGTCSVEVVEGNEMLSPKTDVEKELLKKTHAWLGAEICVPQRPKTWRLACQATVGNPDSTGQMIIQQLPEWKIHEWDKQ